VRLFAQRILRTRHLSVKRLASAHSAEDEMELVVFTAQRSIERVPAGTSLSGAKTT
jgi:hypothetical protein